MPQIKDSHWSSVGDGNQSRYTINYLDGSSRDVTENKDKSITVTDTNSKGEQVSGDGCKGIIGFQDAVRLNSK